MLDFINWAPDVVAFHVFGFPVRWYSLCWCAALFAGYLNMKRLYKKQNIDEKYLEQIFLYCFFSVLIGARLGHCLFYEPGYFLSHPIEMFLPIRHFDTGWKLVGYEGLSSHGGVFGMIFAIWLYARRTGIRFIHVLDNMGILTPLSAAFIRLGNLMNSEIVGKPTTKPWGFIFENNGETFARHPGQLYESIAYVVIFVIILLVYRRYPKRVGTGLYFGLCLTLIFTFRFFIEFIKADQEAFEAGYLLNMGQVLSIPLIAVGIYSMVHSKKGVGLK
ncbi:MAG: prolipoprotein diacylglyceryl transferase [Bacteroidaceae bacterium]|jgi:prolipoprotein diacylglyceryl transferase|nr:prolipoprotein diacylglyceryl transferase [Bacteroidaceae bacterium]